MSRDKTTSPRGVVTVPLYADSGAPMPEEWLHNGRGCVTVLGRPVEWVRPNVSQRLLRIATAKELTAAGLKADAFTARSAALFIANHQHFCVDRNTRPEPTGEARSEAEAPFWNVCRNGNEGRLRRALDDAWAAAGGRPFVWASEYLSDKQSKQSKQEERESLSIFRLEDLIGSAKIPIRTALVVAKNATSARRAATAEAKRLKHRDPEVWMRPSHPTVGGAVVLRIAIASPLGGLHRAGEILRLDDKP